MPDLKALRPVVIPSIQKFLYLLLFFSRARGYQLSSFQHARLEGNAQSLVLPKYSHFYNIPAVHLQPCMRLSVVSLPACQTWSLTFRLVCLQPWVYYSQSIFQLAGLGAIVFWSSLQHYQAVKPVLMLHQLFSHNFFFLHFAFLSEKILQPWPRDVTMCFQARKRSKCKLACGVQAFFVHVSLVPSILQCDSWI